MQTTNNKQQTTNNKQQTTNNKQQTTSNKQQTTSNKQQTTRVWQFELLRCLACLSVVLLHSTGHFVVSEESYDFFGALMRSASSAGVPLFVMISGYFLLSNPKNVNCNYFYERRLKRIGVPLLFWSFFYVVLFVSMRWIKGASTIKASYVLGWLYQGTPGSGYHLWYLYMILGLYAITPFLTFIYKNYSTKVVLSLCVLLYLAYFIQSNYLIYRTNSYRSSLFAPLLSVAFIPYFIFGKYFGDKTTSDASYREKSKIIGTAAAFVFCTVSLFETWLCGKISYKWGLCILSPLVTLQAVSVYLFVLSIKAKPREKTSAFLERISSLTFGIYLFHAFFLLLVSILRSRLLHCEPTTLVCVASAFVAFFASAVSTAIFKKIPYLRECV